MGMSQEEIIQKAADNNAAPTTNSSQETGKRGSKTLEGIKNSFVGKSAPCLATVYSACFKVYSAKKFPGVADSTELSRSFAKQGIKISIRKESKSGDKRKRGNEDGEDGDDGQSDDDDQD